MGSINFAILGSAFAVLEREISDPVDLDVHYPETCQTNAVD